MFHSVNRSRVSQLSSVRHSTIHDVPISIYFTTKLHALTKQKQLVDMVHHIRFAVSYDRYLQLFIDAGNTVCKPYEDSHIVCPSVRSRPKAMVDNGDYNPSSRQADDAFYGTNISF